MKTQEEYDDEIQYELQHLDDKTTIMLEDLDALKDQLDRIISSNMFQNLKTQCDEHKDSFAEIPNPDEHDWFDKLSDEDADKEYEAYDQYLSMASNLRDLAFYVEIILSRVEDSVDELEELS